MAALGNVTQPPAHQWPLSSTKKGFMCSSNASYLELVQVSLQPLLQIMGLVGSITALQWKQGLV